MYCVYVGICGSLEAVEVLAALVSPSGFFIRKAHVCCLKHLSVYFPFIFLHLKASLTLSYTCPQQETDSERERCTCLLLCHIIGALHMFSLGSPYFMCS